MDHFTHNNNSQYMGTLFAPDQLALLPVPRIPAFPANVVLVPLQAV